MKVRVVRLAALASAMGLTLLGGVGTALAHIDPDPAAVEAGSSVTVGFGVEHGCDGSPTTGLAFEVPDGVTDAQPVEKDGWTAGTADGVVSFTGGTLDPDTPDTFSIAFTAPTEAGTILFPVVQTCAEGQIAWIEIPVEGAEEPENPAPALTVTAGAPTSDELAPEHDEETEGEHADTSEGDHDSGVVADSVAESTPADSATPDVTIESVSASNEDDPSNTGVIVAAILAVVIIGGGAAIVLSRRNSSPDN